MRSRPWAWLLPVVGIAVVVALPLVRHVQKTRAEAAAVEFLRRVHVAQAAFRAARADGGYASDLASLTTPCSDATAGVLAQNDLAVIRTAGYAAQLRPAEGATALSVDCHGRTTFSDYYTAAEPESVEAAGQQAFAATATGRIFVFFDGIAPLEGDMSSQGLATPLEALGAFKIP